MTETRGSYTPSQGDSTSGDSSHYDENGLDQWGFTAADKQRMMATLAKRLSDQQGTMAALLADYRRIEGISEETLRERLEISPEQFTRLSLCLVPRNDTFADDVRRIAEICGAKVGVLANLVRAVTALQSLPPRAKPASDTTTAEADSRTMFAERHFMMAARDRKTDAPSVHESRDEYAPDAPQPASKSDTADSDTPESNPPAETPPVDASHDD